MTPDPCRAHKMMTVQAVVCIRNYSKQIDLLDPPLPIPNEMSVNAYFTCMCTESKCINSQCSCARRRMSCC